MQVLDVLDGFFQRVHLAQLLVLAALWYVLPEGFEPEVDLLHAVPLPLVPTSHGGGLGPREPQRREVDPPLASQGFRFVLHVGARAVLGSYVAVSTAGFVVVIVVVVVVVVTVVVFVFVVDADGRGLADGVVAVGVSLQQRPQSLHLLSDGGGGGRGLCLQHDARSGHKQLAAVGSRHRDQSPYLLRGRLHRRRCCHRGGRRPRR